MLNTYAKQKDNMLDANGVDKYVQLHHVDAFRKYSYFARLSGLANMCNIRDVAGIATSSVNVHVCVKQLLH